MSLNPYEQAKAFHDKFHPSQNHQPTAFPPKEAGHRAGFKAEELVEFLYAAANNDPQEFKTLVEGLKESIDRAVIKITDKGEQVVDPLVEEVDALIDTLYFTYGSFVLMGVDPTDIFKIVHEANMGKLFPDGQPHFHPVTGKVMKPENWQRDFAPEGKIKGELQKQVEKPRQSLLKD